MNSTPLDTWKLVSASPLPHWVLWALAFGLLAAVVLASLGVLREPSRGRRWSLWLLRALAAVCALFFLIEPALRNVQVARLKSRVAVLVDRSASMNFPVEAGGATRSSEVSKGLSAWSAQLDALKDRYAFEFYGIDPELTPLGLEQLDKDPARAGRTDLLAALRAVKASDASGPRKLAGVLLFSDGADNAELAQGVAGRAKASLKDLGVPVSTFVVGTEGLKDLAIESVKVDDFAFVRNSVSAEVEVKAHGFSGDTVPVILKREGQVVATKQVRFSNGDDTQQVSFTFTPDQTGRFVYTVSVPVYPGEAVAENNTRSFTLKVIRDRMRVLLVAGRPSWDERYLRGLLKQDANVELISFYILRNSGDNTRTQVDDRELSLIPFPMDEIFREKIDTFDVIVFLNFGYTEPQISIASYERYLTRYLSNGGALALVGGDRSFSESRYPFNVLADALPVEPAAPADLQPFKARLTADGARHPVTAIGGAGLSAEAAWNALPAVPGANLTKIKPGATVLLDHPFATVGGQSVPILALWDYGRGRVMALMTDGSWAWAFGAHSGGSPVRSYEKFWGNALRWLVRDPDLTTLQVTAEAAAVEPGRPVGVQIVARMPDYQPAAEADVIVDLISVEDQKVVGTLNGKTSADGLLSLQFPPPAPGAYKLVGRASKADKSLGEGQDAVAVRALGAELSDARVGTALMEEIASLTGGKSFALPSLPALDRVPLLEPPLVELGRSKDQPIWDRWYWLLALVTVLGMEWALRRRFGYV